MQGLLISIICIYLATGTSYLCWGKWVAYPGVTLSYQGRSPHTYDGMTTDLNANITAGVCKTFSRLEEMTEPAVWIRIVYSGVMCQAENLESGWIYTSISWDITPELWLYMAHSLWTTTIARCSCFTVGILCVEKCEWLALREAKRQKDKNASIRGPFRELFISMLVKVKRNVLQNTFIFDRPCSWLHIHDVCNLVFTGTIFRLEMRWGCSAIQSIA